MLSLETLNESIAANVRGVENTETLFRDVRDSLKSFNAIYQALETELGAIADNMAEGCYSNDPDDGIDWSDCPGISHSPGMKM